MRVAVILLLNGSLAHWQAKTHLKCGRQNRLGDHLGRRYGFEIWDSWPVADACTRLPHGPEDAAQKYRAWLAALGEFGLGRDFSADVWGEIATDDWSAVGPLFRSYAGCDGGGTYGCCMGGELLRMLAGAIMLPRTPESGPRAMGGEAPCFIG